MRDVPDSVRKIMDGPVPAVGARTNSMLRIGYALGEKRWSNHDILTVLEDIGDRWGCIKSPQENKYYRYQKLIGMVRKIREKYPSPR